MRRDPESARLQALPLLAGADLDAPLAWQDGRPLSRRRYLADAAALAASLPAVGPVLAMTADRYRFALALGAAMLRGQFNLLPPNHTADTVQRLRTLFPLAYALVETDGIEVALPTVPLRTGGTAIALPAVRPAVRSESPGAATSFDPGNAAAGSLPPVTIPAFTADTIVAQVLTSGSTGAPLPHAKTWGLLVVNIDAEAERIAEHLGRRNLAGVNLVGTVPAHHMYGFESTVLIALRGGAAFATERPFFPAEIVQSLQRVPRPRVLVTTPFHLKTLLESGLALPALDLTVCATAPLSPQLALRAEQALGAPLMEIYGCTEAGQVATRRTTAGPEWQTFRGLTVSGDGPQAIVNGGHVPQPTPLADVLEVITPTRFRLLGRSNDLINIAGKRGSLSHLNYHLNSIEGVRDGVFWLPAAADDPAAAVEDVVRLVAFVVGELPRERLLAQLRQRIDAAFLPRRIVRVDSLPRDATGKLPAHRLAELAHRLLAGRGAAGGGAAKDGTAGGGTAGNGRTGASGAD